MTQNGNSITLNSRTAPLTKEAVTALLNAPANREGAVPQAPAYVLAELSRLGFVGAGGGLTRSGVIRRGIEHERLLSEMF